MCATKLHGAEIDGPAVAGPSFFAIRWRTKLHPETIIKVRSGLFSFVLIFLIKQKCVSVCVNCCFFIRGSRRLPVPLEGLVCTTKLHGAKIDYQRQPQAAFTPGGCSVCNEVARSEIFSR